MQSYTAIAPGTTLDASRPLILDNDLTAMSCSSGTVFPTQNLVVGQLCFRTDQNKLYMLTALTPTWTLVIDIGISPWHTNNDGAGSGLDADLLDGQHGSYYAPLASPTFTGTPIAGGTLFQVGPTAGTRVQFRNDGFLSINGGGFAKIWHEGNDGPGSGLDADLLDGQDSSYYTAIASRLGYTPANRAGDTFTGLITTRTCSGAINVNTQGTPGIEVYGNAGAGDAAYMTFHRSGFAVRFGLDTDNVLKVGGWSMGNVAYTIWHSGNFDPNSKANLTNAGFSGSVTAVHFSSSADIWAAANISAGGAMYASNWFRSYGNTGWYNETYGGGINMTDTTYVRVYGGKQFYCDSNITSNATMWATGFQIISERSKKQDIEPVKGGALERVLNWDLYEYAYKSHPEKRVIGMMADDADSRISDGKGIDLHSALFELAAAFKEYVRTH